MGNYSTAIDKKWQDKWAESGLYKFDPNKEGENLRFRNVLIPFR